MVARAACVQLSAATERLRCWLGSLGYPLATAQALIGADLSEGNALSNALRACMQHRQSVSHSHRQARGWYVARAAWYLSLIHI